MARNTSEGIILTIDVGTSSIRCLAFGPDGGILESSSFDYAPVYHTNGQVRQSPADWKKGAADVVSRTVHALGEKKRGIAAVALTSQRASLISIDRDGIPLHDAIMWHDKTTSPQCAEIAERVDMEKMYHKTGLRIDSYFTAPKILWLRKHFPDLYARADTFLGVQDYVAYTLTGRRVTDYSQASRTLLFNIWDQCWDGEILDALGIEAGRLPELLMPGTICGSTTSEFSELTGMAGRVPVVLAGGDQQVAAIGMGIFDQHTAEVNTGTGSFVITLTDEPVVHPRMKTLCSYSAVPGRWVAEAGVLTSGIVYKWFTEQFAHEKHEQDGSRDFHSMDKLVAASPAGSNGLITLPHFKGAAAPFWNPNARGIFFNVTLAHTKGDFARSIIESIALEVACNIKLLNEIDRVNIENIIVAGGMTSFGLFNQIQADVYNMPVRKDPHTEASSFGAFLSTLAAIERYTSVFSAYQDFSKNGPLEKYTPDPAAADIYRTVTAQRTDLYNAMEAGGMYDSIPSFEKKLRLL